MGRGLSELQKTVLRLARENREREVGTVVMGRYFLGTDVTRAEVLAAYFGWEPEGERTDGRRFKKEDVGEKAYRSAVVSLSRALKRLEARGLVELTHSMRAGGWSGADLTEDGLEEARRLAGHPDHRDETHSEGVGVERD